MSTVMDFSEVESPQELSIRLNLPFSDVRLLNRALTHRSFLNENQDAIEDNERLEFLGDAVLDFVVGAWLYNHFPEMSEGELTKMRSALVHTEQLAEFARKIHLGSAMRLGRGEIQAGGRNRPALLCDTFEALIGAIFLDGDIKAVKQFTDPFWENAVEDILITHKNEDPKSRFQEWSQGEGYSAPIYMTRNSKGPDHDKVFEVDAMVDGKLYGTGTGHSKQTAAKAAAFAALKALGLVSEQE